MIDCADPFHTDDAPDAASVHGETYEIEAGGFIAEGYRCRSCGFETMRLQAGPLSAEDAAAADAVDAWVDDYVQQHARL